MSAGPTAREPVLGSDDGAVLLLFPRTTYRVEAFREAARRTGIPLVLATDLAAPRARDGEPIVQVSFADPERAAADIAAWARPRGVRGIVPTDELTAVIAARAAESMGLDHPSPAAARATRDKHLMRARLADAGVPSPRHRRLPEGEPVTSLGEVGFPCVVKPPMLSGSQGVIRANDDAELAEAVARCRRILTGATVESRRLPGFFDLVVEDYLPGEEVSIEALMTAGELQSLAIFDKPIPLTGPYFEETIYVTPSAHSEHDQAHLLEVAEAGARALGLTHGPIHAELRIHDGRASVVEIAARSIGGLCSRIVELVSGPLEDLVLCHAAGRARPAPPPRAGLAAGVMMLPIPRHGVLRGVRGVEEAERTAGVDRVVISARVGQAVRALPEGASYLGFVFARGESPGEVRTTLESAHACLRFEFAPLLTS